jgi:hypothetical protein
LGEVDACNVLFRGEDEDVLEALRIQAKRQASVAIHFEPPVGTDAVAA